MFVIVRCVDVYICELGIRLVSYRGVVVPQLGRSPAGLVPSWVGPQLGRSSTFQSRRCSCAYGTCKTFLL